jgi:hypothetical protein
MITLKTEIAFDGNEDVAVVVTANYLAGSPGARTLSNGDPGYPPDPPEVEICQVALADAVASWDKGKDITSLLPPKTIEALEDLVAEEAESGD